MMYAWAFVKFDMCTDRPLVQQVKFLRLAFVDEDEKIIQGAGLVASGVKSFFNMS